jgi:hypothetical protein
MTAAQKTLATATTALNTTQGDTKKLLGSLQDLSGNLQRRTEETLTALHRVLVHVDEIMAHNDRNLYTSVEYLRDATENLRATARQVRTNPSVLLWGNGNQQEPDAANGADATTRSLQDRGRSDGTINSNDAPACGSLCWLGYAARAWGLCERAGDPYDLGVPCKTRRFACG